MTSVIERDGYLTGLPHEYYTSPEIFEQERERIFLRSWLYAGQVSQITSPGEFFTAQLGPESVIVTRDSENRVRAYFNVCRHRGSQLCDPGTSGRRKRFVCPYHQWSYSIDGDLRGAPGSPDGVDFDYQDFPLHEAACDTFHGAIYVYLGTDEPQPLAEHLAPSVSDFDDLAQVEPERTKVIRTERYPIKANWKLMLENNVECYHCAGAHPELGVAMDYQETFIPRDGEEKLTATIHDAHFPIRDGLCTFSMDGNWVCTKPLGSTPLRDRFSAGYLTMPMFSGPVYFADHGVILSIVPLTVDTSELLAQWVVHEDAVEGEDYDVEAVTKVFHVTNIEDIELTERNQKGVASSRYLSGPLSPTREPGIAAALSTYLTMMGEDVPESLPAVPGLSYK